MNKNFSLKALSLSFCLSISFYFLLAEYFFFIAFFVGVILLSKLRHKNKKEFMIFVSILIFLIVYMILYRINQMGFFMNTYNILDYNLFDLTYTIAHLKWLSLNYWYVVIAIIPSLLIILKSFFNNFRFDFVNKKINFIFLFVLFNLLVIFGYLDNVSYNFTFRAFLFMLPAGIVASVFIFYNVFFQKKTLMYAFLILLIVSNSYVLSSNYATEYGEDFYPYKLFAEKQPLIIDTKTPYLFFENYTDANNITNYSTFVIALNEYPFVYYTNMSPTYLVRWKGSFIGNLSTIGTPIIWDPDEFANTVQEENHKGNSVFIITHATIYPIKNPLYKFIFDKDYAQEANGRIAQILENDFDKYKIYISKDNWSSVYYVPSNIKT